MTSLVWKSYVCMVAAAILAGCGPAPIVVAPPTSKVSSAAAPASDVLLKAQPADAKPVGDVRKSAEDGDAVTILGRIGGDTNPWVEGRAAFTIVDPKLEPCKPDEGCPTPWDYCFSTDQLPTHRALIKIVDGAGDTVEQDARKLLGVKELQTVMVRGQAKRDSAGNLTVLASGVYVVPETK